MSDGNGTDQETRTWHYGLVARWWAEFNVSQPEDDDLPFFRTAIERYGQPALDLACGTGRLLVPLAKAGIDIDGCDVSPDMVALCHERLADEGLTAQLYTQSMHQLDLPRRYRTIFICGAFGLGSGRHEHHAEALRRCYRHLEPGGALVFDHELPYYHAEAWQEWVPDRRPEFPKPWPEEGFAARARNGDELELRTRSAAFDPLEQRVTAQIRVRATREGRVLAEEVHTLEERLFFCDEVVQLLARAGFEEVRVYGGYTDRSATARDSMITFVAVRST